MTTRTTTGLLDRVLHLSVLVTKDLAHFEQDSGLTVARSHVLWSLGLSGPCTQQSLAAALGVTPRNITGLVDALVESGHVMRNPHPTDRRARLVTATELGQRAIRKLVDGHDELARQLFGHLTPRRQASFAATLDETITTFARLMAEEKG